MKTLLLTSLAAGTLLVTSCGGSRGVDYDTAPVADYPGADTSAPIDPTYGAAAYEENTAVPTVEDPGLAAPAAPTGKVTEHYVAPGDSLWKLSKQYGVSIDAIKAANQMTNDTVILGKKMIIPAP
jgi:LysM repeat protein